MSWRGEVISMPRWCAKPKRAPYTTIAPSKPKKTRTPQKAPGESIPLVDAPTLLEQRDCLCCQARHLAQIRLTEPILPSATLVIEVRLFRSSSRTHHYLDARMCVCPAHLIPVLISLSLTHEHFALRAIFPRQSKDFPGPAVPLDGVQIQNHPYLLPGPAKSQHLRA